MDNFISYVTLFQPFPTPFFSMSLIPTFMPVSFSSDHNYVTFNGASPVLKSALIKIWLDCCVSWTTSV